MSESVNPEGLQDYEQRWASSALDIAISRGDSEILVRGARGVGKTIDFCHRFHHLALKYPGMTQCWVRSTRSRLTDSVLKTFENEVLGPKHPLYSTKQREQRSHYRYPNGSEVILMGLDDPERQKSIGVDLMWINEPTDLTEAQWEETGGSTRKQMRNNCPIRLKIGDFNPVAPGHWTTKRGRPLPQHLYPRVIDDGTRMGEWLTPHMYREITRFNLAKERDYKAKLIVYCAADNPGYWDVNEWRWLPPGLEYVQNFLGKMSGHRKQRYLSGIPAAAEGGIFPMFTEETHVVEDFEPPYDWPWYVGVDPGFAHPCAIVWITVAPDGNLYVADEIYEPAKVVQEHMDTIRRMAERRNVVRWFGDPHEAFSNRAQGKSVASQFRDYGLRGMIGWANAPKEGMVMAHADLLTNTVRNLPHTQKIFVLKRCKNAIMEYQTWSFAKNVKGELLKGDDQYENANNHAMDCIIGMTNTGMLKYRGSGGGLQIG